jgi:hypothetical protein
MAREARRSSIGGSYVVRRTERDIEMQYDPHVGPALKRTPDSLRSGGQMAQDKQGGRSGGQGGRSGQKSGSSQGGGKSGKQSGGGGGGGRGGRSGGGNKGGNR